MACRRRDLADRDVGGVHRAHWLGNPPFGHRALTSARCAGRLYRAPVSGTCAVAWPTRRGDWRHCSGGNRGGPSTRQSCTDGADARRNPWHIRLAPLAAPDRNAAGCRRRGDGNGAGHRIAPARPHARDRDAPARTQTHRSRPCFAWPDLAERARVVRSRLANDWRPTHDPHRRHRRADRRTAAARNRGSAARRRQGEEAVHFRGQSSMSTAASCCALWARGGAGGEPASSSATRPTTPSATPARPRAGCSGRAIAACASSPAGTISRAAC